MCVHFNDWYFLLRIESGSQNHHHNDLTSPVWQ